ncbi:MAG: YceI family protein [Chitinophagales bacterium]
MTTVTENPTTTLWKIDPSHSEIKFKVKHLMISTVSGHFEKFDASVETEDDDFENAQITFEADIDSVSTKDPKREVHLKTSDFFDAANYPKMTFVSKSFRKTNANDYKLVGDLTIRGITKEVKLDVRYHGLAKAWGAEIVAFEIIGKINRLDFGLHWNAATEAGGVIVSDEVKLEINAEFKKVVPA